MGNSWVDCFCANVIAIRSGLDFGRVQCRTHIFFISKSHFACRKELDLGLISRRASAVTISTGGVDLHDMSGSGLSRSDAHVVAIRASNLKSCSCNSLRTDRSTISGHFFCCCRFGFWIDVLCVHRRRLRILSKVVGVRGRRTGSGRDMRSPVHARLTTRRAIGLNEYLLEAKKTD